ncbi:MAG TPA: Rrf2 family transcriptional regulator [Ruminococcaceae bacterium]|nr:Rrf2 family transcriptional regulator [Oscillospiraceae bacterium]
MQFSVGVEYALHCLLYMVDLPTGQSVGIKDLAAYQGISSTYLSKVYTKLQKAGLVKTVPGVHGGCALAIGPDAITFWDVVEAVEGGAPLFQCAEIRQREAILDPQHLPAAYRSDCPCLIKTVMVEAEEQMRTYLKKKTLRWLADQVEAKVPAEQQEKTKAWFAQAK